MATATPEALIPAGWETYTNPGCGYTISYPPEMQVTDNGANSRTLGFKLADPDKGARNFVYISVIPKDLKPSADEPVYNYDPAEAEILLKMQVGDSKPVRQVANGESAFTYRRQQDTMIGGHTAKAYENDKPWEFPPGTKEIRYYLTRNGCVYLIGGYVDTTGSNQPGAITEDLFHRILATVQLP